MPTLAPALPALEARRYGIWPNRARPRLLVLQFGGAAGTLDALKEKGPAVGQALAQNLGLETTLLGVDVIEDGRVIARDVNETELFALVEGHPTYLLVTAIGGQGHIIGRGNQQISPRVLRTIGLEHLRVIATKRKLGTLEGRPLRVDSGDPALDEAFPDAVRVWSGYREELLYPLG